MTAAFGPLPQHPAGAWYVLYFNLIFPAFQPSLSLSSTSAFRAELSSCCSQVVLWTCQDDLEDCTDQSTEPHYGGGQHASVVGPERVKAYLKVLFLFTRIVQRKRTKLVVYSSLMPLNWYTTSKSVASSRPSSSSMLACLHQPHRKYGVSA